MKIITFCNYNYIPVTQNWLNFIMKLDILKSDILIVTLDKESESYFDNFNTLFRPVDVLGNDLSALWVHRINIFDEILRDGNDIIHSDSDAIWLKNPINFVKDCKSEIVFSQGTVWPLDVFEKHEIVLCCGFFYLKSSENTFKFLKELKERVIFDKDDQISVNRLISQSINNWDVYNPYYIKFNKYQFKCSEKTMTAKTIFKNDDNYNISLLPHIYFPRIINDLKFINQTYVAHPLSGKNLKSKIEILSILGLWSL